MRKSKWQLFIICIGVFFSAVEAAELVNVTALARNGRVLVSFELAGAITDDVRSTIRSGLPTTFEYDVRLIRELVFWPDSTVAAATLATTVRYDNLTEQYNIARMLDGRVEDTMVVEDEGQVELMLAQFDRIPLFSTVDLEPNMAYRLLVSLEMSPRNSWFGWPWSSAAAFGGSQFTFIP